MIRMSLIAAVAAGAVFGPGAADAASLLDRFGQIADGEARRNVVRVAHEPKGPPVAWLRDPVSEGVSCAPHVKTFDDGLTRYRAVFLAEDGKIAVRLSEIADEGKLAYLGHAEATLARLPHFLGERGNWSGFGGEPALVVKVDDLIQHAEGRSVPPQWVQDLIDIEFAGDVAVTPGEPEDRPTFGSWSRTVPLAFPAMTGAELTLTMRIAGTPCAVTWTWRPARDHDDVPVIAEIGLPAERWGLCQPTFQGALLRDAQEPACAGGFDDVCEAACTYYAPGASTPTYAATVRWRTRALWTSQGLSSVAARKLIDGACAEGQPGGHIVGSTDVEAMAFVGDADRPNQLALARHLLDRVAKRGAPCPGPNDPGRFAGLAEARSLGVSAFVSNVGGDVTVAQDIGPPVPAWKGMPLFPGDVISVGEGGVELIYADEVTGIYGERPPSLVMMYRNAGFVVGVGRSQPNAAQYAMGYVLKDWKGWAALGAITMAALSVEAWPILFLVGGSVMIVDPPPPPPPPGVSSGPRG